MSSQENPDAFLDDTDAFLAEFGEEYGSSPPPPPTADDGEQEDVPIGPTPSAPVAAPKESPLRILVSNAIKVGEGMGGFVVYEIRTESSLSGYAPSKTVRRRFREFTWLQAELGLQLPGSIVPALPEKNAMRSMMGRFSEDDVESRRRGLERFLGAVAAHPLLGRLDLVRDFLQADSLDAARGMAVHTREGDEDSAASAPAPAQAAGGFLSWVGGAVSSTVSSISHTLSSAELPKTAEDAEWEELQAYVDAVEPQLVKVHKHAAALVARERDLAAVYSDFAMAAAGLGEAETGTYGAAFRELGRTADRIAGAGRDGSAAEALVFEEPLRSYAKMVGSARQALDQRKAAYTRYCVAVHDEQAKEQALRKVRESSNRPDRASAAEAAVEEAGSRVRAAKRTLDTVHKRVTEEMARFTHEKVVDFRQIMVDFVEMQVQQSRAMEQAWRDLLPHVSAIDDGVDVGADPGI